MIKYVQLFIWISLFPGVSFPKIRIFENANVNAAIMYRSNNAGNTLNCAEILAQYLKKSTGSIFPIITEKSSNYKVTIYLQFDNERFTSDKVLFQDGFRINFPDKNTIVISANNEKGVEYGVYDFLERFVGIRWLYPGKQGEYIPKHTILDIPMQTIEGESPFMMRRISGLRGKEEVEWGRKNRMFNSEIKFHHNLANIFPPEKYGISHPEFYPVIKGKRYIPPAGVKVRWQPCFSALGLVEEAVKTIYEYFEKHPDEISFSLGVNDSWGYCECNECLAKVKGDDKKDYSDLYYNWANSVVNEVIKKYPNKWFGCLAHTGVARPPSDFKLNPNIIPFLTYDRLKWSDPVIKAESQNLHVEWSQKASNIGWYDYIYGEQYLIPRIYFHEMASYLQYGAEKGVKYLYSEAYPHWKEGPKLYLALRLQWNPYINVDSTLNDWYQCAVGSDAAPYLSQYFSFWEEFWTLRIPHSDWFTAKKTYRGTYLPFKNTGYVNILSKQDIQYCKELLDSVSVKAVSSDQKERAKYFISTFVDYEKEVIDTKKKIDFRGMLNYFDFK